MTVTIARQTAHSTTTSRSVPGSRARRVPVPAGANPDSIALDLGALTLESGTVLPDVVATAQTWGTLAPSPDNVVLVQHALTGDSHVSGPVGPGQPTAGWWPGLIGRGAPLDPDRHFIICVNTLGGCRGTTGPASPHPDGKGPWGSRWPSITVRDQVAVERLVCDQLGVDRIELVLGGSMGGMRVLEWAASFPDRVRGALALATTPWATADQIAWGHTQTMAITSDANWRGGDYLAQGVRPDAGLGLARRIAHTTYRSAAELDSRFGLRPQTTRSPIHGGQFAVQSYLDHQAAKLVDRFDAGSYVTLTEAMATHDVTRGRGSLAETFADYAGVLRLAAVDTDRLFPPVLSEAVVEAVPAAELDLISSLRGHDGFLIETDQVDWIIRRTIDQVEDARESA